MNKIEMYQQAASWLEEAARECNKSENVDIDLLIRNCQSCVHCVGSLMSAERDSWKTSALHELSSALGEHLRILLAKKQQLAAADTKEAVSGEMKDEVDDKQGKSRRIAIQETIVKRGVTTKFSDVAGLGEAKQTLKEAIILPVQFPQLFTGGRKPWRRILLYGPPGTGKTRLAKAVASEIQSTFYSVSSSDVVSSWVGESEKLIKELFHDAKERDGQSVIFIDEIDSICRKRNTREEEYTRRIKNELLKQMEGADSDAGGTQFFLLCATNCPWELDSAFIRRFQKRIYIPLPNKEARIALLKMHLVSTPVLLAEMDWALLGERTEGLSGSDLANCTSDALFEPVRELQCATHWKQTADGYFVPCSRDDHDGRKGVLTDLPADKVQPRQVMLQDFLKCLSQNSGTVSRGDLEKFNNFTQNYGQMG